MSNPKVSIMLPSYNHGRYIKEAIDSALNQTYSDFELILSDDCSPDNTMEIVAEYHDPRILVHRFEHNVGAAENHYYCYAHARGEYIALLNSDDVWLPERLEREVAFLDANPEYGAVFSWGSIVDENSKLIDKCPSIFRQPNRTRQEWLLYFFTHGNCICHPSMLIRKEVYDTVGFYSKGMRQIPDFEQWIRVLKKYPIHIMQEVLVAHRRCINTMQNTSAPVITNSIRDVNECSFVLRHFFDGMDDEEFRSIFHPIFRNPQAATHEELVCERFFLMKDDKYYMKQIGQVLAFQYYLESCNQSNVMETYRDQYGFTLGDFHKFGSEMDVLGLQKDVLKAETVVNTVVEGQNSASKRLKALAWAVFGKDSPTYLKLQEYVRKRRNECETKTN